MKPFGAWMREGNPRCCILFCDGYRSLRYAHIPMCQEHILAAWAAVERDMRQANMTPDDAEREYQERERQAQEERKRTNQAAAKARQHGTIYYLRVGEHIKIGFSKDVYVRLRQYPPTAVLLATRPGTRLDEKALHGQFAAYLHAGREWFRDVPELRDHINGVIAEHGAPEKNPLGRPTKRQPRKVKPFKAVL